MSTRWLGEEVWGLATRQHGVVERGQLLALGASRRLIDRWLREGRVRPIHRSVYLVGHGAPTLKGWCMAAVLACGEGAAASHRCAAWLHGLIAWLPHRPAVSVPVGRRSRPPGIAVHRIQRVEPVLLDAIPTTPVARTIIDMAAISRRRTLERVIEEAVINDVFDLAEIHRTLDRIARPRGVRLLRAVLADIRPGTTVTRSDLEEAMLALVDRAGLPRPICNADIAGYEVDFLWPAKRVIVETDSNRYHATHPKRRADRAKDRALQLAGCLVLRAPEEDLEVVVADLRTALGH